MRVEGLEPPRLAPPAPKAGVSTGSTTPARRCMFPHGMADDDVILDHPNRDKASSKAARAIVVLLLLVSVALMLVIAIGGWDFLVGAKALFVAYILVYLVFAYYIARWNRGVLPVIAAFAIVLGIFAALAGLAWFDRDKE